MIIIMLEDLYATMMARSKGPRQVSKGGYLFHQGDRIKSMFLVSDGSVELTRYHDDGMAIVLQVAKPTSVIAEASAYAARYHCDGLAIKPSTVCEIDRKVFLGLLAENPELAAAWSAHLAHEVQVARSRSEILARNKVADRLDGWLAWRGEGLPGKGEWKIVAEQIGVSPEALYRELAKRRAD
jgi:CRP-like cAMP-binding protein